MDSELPGGTKNERVFLSPLPHKTFHDNYDKDFKRARDCVERAKHARKPVWRVCNSEESPVSP